MTSAGDQKTGNNLEDLPLTSTHWGTYGVETSGGRVVALHDFDQDPSPSPIGHGIVDVLDGATRIDAPMIRRGWLENGPGSTDRRGRDQFVRVSWQEAERLVGDELARVKSQFGNQAIFAGSYGWASAGRFHHAQSQIHRFLNCIGGYTRSKNTYSFAAAEVLMPHIVGAHRAFMYPGNSWRTVIEHTELMVAFGGIPIKNGQISQGGVGRHRQPSAIREAAAAGIEFVNVSPQRSDVEDITNAEWLALRPSTDTAVLLGLAHTVLVDGLHDQAFLDRYTAGFDRFKAYLTGETDGVAKSADWASAISGLEAHKIRELARRMASRRTMLSTSWSLTRQDHGEQPYWAAIALAAMLGQIGSPGGGISFGFSAVNAVGNEFRVLYGAALPQGDNPVEHFIPVARISDLLLKPGEQFHYDGHVGTYPDIKLVYWAGGNPFHHHQDLNRMLQAWQRPDTIIAHEWCWNGLARHADIVLPCATHLEREDIAFTPRDGFLVYMEQAVKPHGQSRSDYDILSGIARHMGVEDAFTEGRSTGDWLEYLYNRTLQTAAETGVELPTLPELRERRWFEMERPKTGTVNFREFRADPEANPLKTPSGRIEIFSDTIAGFGYDDCPGHPTWMEPAEWLGKAKPGQLHLISNQPANKLHSQLDHGAVSRADKIDGREPVTVHPDDAEARGIKAGDVVRIFNKRGSFYCGVKIDAGIRKDVICVSTGAWFDPLEKGTPTACKHGNPNMVTLDKGTSSLAQGPIAHTCLVEMERADNPPPVTAYEPPQIVDRDA